jgi:hypothetical protein
MKKEIFQLQVVLDDSKPKIWRRLLIPSNILLSDLHKIIQTAMGWENAHLHHFIKDNKFYTPPSKGDSHWNNVDHVEYKKLRLHDFLHEEKDTFVYEYDFRDKWMHTIVLEKVMPMDQVMKHPVCLTGKMRCPPEDSGGIIKYTDLTEKLVDPKGEGYKSAADWLGTEYDPEYFDKDEVNALLKTKNYGCY